MWLLIHASGVAISVQAAKSLIHCLLESDVVFNVFISLWRPLRRVFIGNYACVISTWRLNLIEWRVLVCHRDPGVTYAWTRAHLLASDSRHLQAGTSLIIVVSPPRMCWVDDAISNLSIIVWASNSIGPPSEFGLVRQQFTVHHHRHKQAHRYCWLLLSSYWQTMLG